MKVLFSFLKHYDFNGSLIIADASDISAKSEIESYIGDLNPGFKVKYLWVPNKPVLESLIHLSQNVTTPYSMIIGDDDFIVPAAIRRACQILRKSSNEMIGVTGKAIDLNTQDFKYGIYKTCELSGENALERIKNFLKNYWVISHTVLRSEYLSRIFSVEEIKNLPRT